MRKNVSIIIIMIIIIIIIIISSSSSSILSLFSFYAVSCDAYFHTGAFSYCAYCQTASVLHVRHDMIFDHVRVTTVVRPDS
jgi:hypothetical protein